LAPANPFADSNSKSNPYPYSVSAAKDLLTSHGWKMVNGVMTCVSPGNSATECGQGVSKNLALNLNLQYASGNTSVTQEMDAYQSAAKQAGININLSSATFDTVIGNAAPCKPSQAACKWEMENWAGGWEYSPDNYPTGGEIFGTGAGSNFGSYDSSEANALIAATHTSSNPQAALDDYQNYMVKNLPVIYQPSADYAISLISSKLGGVTQNPYLNLTPENWYFTK
jgi:peptide/nickel transport system substrate-binding protein